MVERQGIRDIMQLLLFAWKNIVLGTIVIAVHLGKVPKGDNEASINRNSPLPLPAKDWYSQKFKLIYYCITAHRNGHNLSHISQSQV